VQQGPEQSTRDVAQPTVAAAAQPREPAARRPAPSVVESASPGADEGRAPSGSTPPRPKPSASASEPTIDEEVKLMNAAQAALRAGDATRALLLLREHAARFPTGKLATARQVTRMMALCQAGQGPQARREAASFLTKNPDSPFAERVERLCPAPK
jgi:hypothetical protein